MKQLNNIQTKKLLHLTITILSIICLSASNVCSAPDNQLIPTITTPDNLTETEIQAPLIQLAENETNTYRVFKSDKKTVQSAKKEEGIFSKPGNIVLAGLAAIAIGSAAYISTEYEEEKIASIGITTPVENEEVFWITAIQGTSINFKEGDHVSISLQKHGEQLWIEQEGYGAINQGSGDWIVRFNQFGFSGPGDIGSSFRFIATMKDYKDRILAQESVENVIRK